MSDPAAAPARPWPPIFRAFKRLARAGDRGLGDIVARTVGPVGGDAFKAWYQRAYGRSCGCSDRQEALNALYPLPPAAGD